MGFSMTWVAQEPKQAHKLSTSARKKQGLLPGAVHAD